MSNIIQLPKRFDYSAMNDFNATINTVITGKHKKIFLDAMLMDYIDSSGLGLLVMAYKKIHESNSSMTIINLKPSAREILLLANLQKLIDIK
ncbi:MAG: anti-sigma factor antagonist [Gammaproteobacteria bacterium]|nr:MAG: anti-sigma factor antagonist [Gammaproteobacteria bacterium]